MAITSVPYLDGLGTTRQLKVDITNGITTFVYMTEGGGSSGGNVGIINGSNQWSIDASGNGRVSFFGNSQPVYILDGANPLSINATGAALVRNISTQPFFINDFGTSADVSNPVGSLMARLRSLLVDTVGATADAASAVTTLMARIRLIAQSYSQPNLFTRFGTSTTDTLSGTPCRLLGGCAWNKSSSVRYLQFFNRTTNPTTGTVPVISRVLAPNERYSWQHFDFGSNDGYNFTTGLAWAFSTTESTYTAGTTTDISVEIYWR
jgi:hypothetical protein